MLRIRADKTIKPELRHKSIQLLNGDASVCQVRLLENTGSFKPNDELTLSNSQIEEYNETTGTSRFYDPLFAESLDERLNQPYEMRGVPCGNITCNNESGYNYEMTGYVVTDTQGIYVEKKCEHCGTITTDGDGDFHNYYRIENGEIIDIESVEPFINKTADLPTIETLVISEPRVPELSVERNNDAIDERLFMHYDNGDIAELEKELYALVDNYAKNFKSSITADERELVVRRTIQYIDQETQSIDACLCDHLSALD